MRQAHAGCVARGLVQIQTEARAFFKFLFVVGKGANTKFRALKVGQNTDGRIQVFFDLTNNRVAFGDLFMGTVAHVQAENVGACFVKGADHFVIRRGRAKRGHDFHITTAFHERSCLSKSFRITVNANG